jgi:hypothetical protein
MGIAFGHFPSVAAAPASSPKTIGKITPNPRAMRMMAPTITMMAPRHDGPLRYGFPAPAAGA